MKFFTRTLLITLFCVVVLPAMLVAETRYVTEIMQVTLRTGQGTKHKVIAIIDSGKQVTLVEPGKNWSRVRVDDKEGWVMTRFLTQQKPRVVRLEALETKYGNLDEKYRDLKADWDVVSKENKTLKTDLASTRAELEDVTRAYNNLKNKSENFLKLESQLQKTTEQLTEQSASVNGLRQQLQQKNIHWFLCGAGVLLFGIVLGLSFKRKDRRRLM